MGQPARESFRSWLHRLVRLEVNRRRDILDDPGHIGTRVLLRHGMFGAYRMLAALAEAAAGLLAWPWHVGQPGALRVALLWPARRHEQP